MTTDPLRAELPEPGLDTEAMPVIPDATRQWLDAMLDAWLDEAMNTPTKTED